MKLLVISLVTLLSAAMVSDKKLEDCQCKGKNLWGRVKIVDSFEDFRVKEVTSFPDLFVRKESIPLKCGEWHFVEFGEDFKIRFVDSGEDFTIKYDPFPGVTNY